MGRVYWRLPCALQHHHWFVYTNLVSHAGTASNLARLVMRWIYLVVRFCTAKAAINSVAPLLDGLSRSTVTGCSQQSPRR